MEDVVYLLLAFIIVVQFALVNSTRKKINSYKRIFPNIDDDSITYSEERINTNFSGHSFFKKIIDNLNRYLGENKDQTSDYHLMRDIVERNVEIKENEISIQIPFPLYAGLMGTMLDILIGVFSFVQSGGVQKLIDTSAQSTEGISDLLRGVSLAMLTAALGILFTGYSSYRFKNARKDVESAKDDFLSWIQAKLLPNVSTNLVNQLSKMAQNLKSFNDAFSENTKDLKETLSMVNTSYERQTELLKAIEKIDIRRVASANIEIYDRLQGCTNELQTLGYYLNNTNQYLQNVRLLNDQLGAAEGRVKMIEQMGQYFMRESAQVDQRKAVVAAAVGEVDKGITAALEALQEKSRSVITTFTTTLDNQTRAINTVFEDQKKVFEEKLDEIGVTISERNKSYAELCDTQEKGLIEASEKFSENTKELKNLAEIRNGILSLEKALNKLDRGTVEVGDIHVTSKTPSWMKPCLYLICFALFIIAVSCCLYIGQFLIQLFK